MALFKPLDNQQLLHSSLYASKQKKSFLFFCLFVCLFVCFLFCFSATASVGAVYICTLL